MITWKKNRFSDFDYRGTLARLAKKISFAPWGDPCKRPLVPQPQAVCVLAPKPHVQRLSTPIDSPVVGCPPACSPRNDISRLPQMGMKDGLTSPWLAHYFDTFLLPSLPLPPLSFVLLQTLALPRSVCSPSRHQREWLPMAPNPARGGCPHRHPSPIFRDL